MPNRRKPSTPVPSDADYDRLIAGIAELLDHARRAARVVNSVLTATYWQIGRQIVEVEQAGRDGQQVVARLAGDLTARFGRGFSQRNLEQMRAF